MKRENRLAFTVMALTAAVATYVSVAAVFIKTLADAATSKQMPSVLKPVSQKIKGEIVSREFVHTVIDTAAKLKLEDTQTVSIKSRDGLTLIGHWYGAKNPKRILIAMHGWRSGWALDFGLPVEFYHNNGCSVLFPDQRSQGESEGEHICFGVMERYDCVDWLYYIINRFGTDLPIYLCGVSMGATTVLMSSSLGLPDTVHGIISDCAFTSPNAIWHHVFKNNLKLNTQFLYHIAKMYITKRAGFGDDVSTVDSVEKTKIPILFIHGENDSFVPVDMTYQNFNACASKKHLLIVKNAEHGMSYFTNPNDYEKNVLSFFELYDNCD